jgi:integral membrane protein (TIGR01906 family)
LDYGESPLNIVRIAAKSLFIFCIPVFFLATSLAWGFNSLWLYQYGFEKYQVSQSTGISASNLEKSARGLIDYFKINSSDDYVHIILIENGRLFELFTQEEQIHFKDVRQLVWLDYKVFLISLFFILGYITFYFIRQKSEKWRQLALDLIWGCGLSLVLIILLGIGSILDFDSLFLQFHYLAFTNQFWSAEGYMLQLFPGGFWLDAALFCFVFMAGLAILTGLLTFLYLRFKKILLR